MYVYTYIYIYMYVLHARSDEHRLLPSGGWKCAVVGVPWRGSVSACLAGGDLFFKKHMFLSGEKAE